MEMRTRRTRLCRASDCVLIRTGVDFESSRTKFPLFTIVGYSNLPEDFDADAPDFDRFLTQIDFIGPAPYEIPEDARTGRRESGPAGAPSTAEDAAATVNAEPPPSAPTDATEPEPPNDEGDATEGEDPSSSAVVPPE